MKEVKSRNVKYFLEEKKREKGKKEERKKVYSWRVFGFMRHSGSDNNRTSPQHLTAFNADLALTVYAYPLHPPGLAPSSSRRFFSYGLTKWA